MSKIVAEPRTCIEAFRMTAAEQARFRAAVPKWSRSEFLRSAVMAAIGQVETYQVKNIALSPSGRKSRNEVHGRHSTHHTQATHWTNCCC
jgi:hypothetical protein